MIQYSLRIADHFCALVEEVFVPIFRNVLNLAKFPECVADGEKDCSKTVSSCETKYIFPDIERQVHELSTSVYQVSLTDLTSVLCCPLSCRCGATSRGRRCYPSHRSDFPHGLLLV